MRAATRQASAAVPRQRDSFFDCPRCTARNFGPNEIEQGYCCHCHDFTGISVNERAALAPDVPLGSTVRILAGSLADDLVGRMHSAPEVDAQGLSGPSAPGPTAGWLTVQTALGEARACAWEPTSAPSLLRWRHILRQPLTKDDIYHGGVFTHTLDGRGGTVAWWRPLDPGEEPPR